MRKITNKEKAQFISRMKTGGRKKSTLRKYLDDMEVGENVVLQRGSDYEDYRKVYFVLKDITRKTNKHFNYEQSLDGKEMLITCIKI